MTHLQPSSGKPRIGLLCLSAIPDDPRVRRQGDLFAGRGWDVVAIGLPGARSPEPDWRHVAAAVQPNTPPDRDVTRLVRRALDLARVHLDPNHVRTAYWNLDRRFSALFATARAHRADIWLANDWTTLPIAWQISAEQGVPYAYDTHEFAVDEYAQSRRWRLLRRPLIAAIERIGLEGAAVTTCVSQGIADRLQALYRLAEKPFVVRNMPRYEEHPGRSPDANVEVLYHGVVSPGRGLEACIESVALWRPEFRLTVRGPVSSAYRAVLRETAARAGVEARFTLASPVPMVDLVRQASAFDIGLFVLPGDSAQTRYVLPNKFFEYTMAGLALCVSDLPEMRTILKRYELGHLIPKVTPEAIADAVNGFDRAGIATAKARSRLAARHLNWEAEGDRMFSVIAAVREAQVDHPGRGVWRARSGRPD